MTKGNANGNGNFLRFWLVLFALAVLPVASHAQNELSRTTAAGHLFTSNGVGYSVGNITGNPPATTVWTLPPGTATGQAVGNFGVGPNAGATGPQAHTRGSFPIPGGNGKAVDVEVKSPINKPAAARAIANLGKSFLGPINVGMALWDLATAMGYGVEDLNGSSQPGIDIYKWKLMCTSPGCYWEASGGGAATRSGTAQGSCELYATTKNLTHTHVTLTGTDPAFKSCNIWNNTTWVAGPGIFRTGQEVNVKNYGSMDELESEIANASGWPTAASRALADALKSAATNPLTNKPDGVAVDAPVVSGPASVPGASSTSSTPIKDPATGAQIGTATTVNNTTHNITYQGSNINITNQTTSTTTNTYNNGQATTTTTTTTGGTPVTPDPPEDPCVKSPDRVGCKLLGTPDSATIPTSTENLTYTPESTGFGDGSCPPPVTWSSTRAGSHSISYQPACDFATTYMRPVALLIGALIALFILMPGRPET